ncbi:MAG: AI-2E family transporter [Flavobacteriales bacterium]|jgi:predicted PurR-regulated permease PerM
MEKTTTLVTPPLYQRLSLILLGLCALFFILWAGQSIVVPLLFSMLLAMLLDPVVKRLMRWRFPKPVAIALSVLLAMAALIGLGYFIVTQAAHFSELVPELKQKSAALMEDAKHWVMNTTKAQPRDVDNAVDKVKEQSLEQGGSIVGQTLTTVGTLFGFLFLLPVFTFLLIFYKSLFHGFLTKLFRKSEHETVDEVLGQTKGVVQSYLVGLIFEAAIVTALNWIGLYFIGVKFALLMAVMAALLNLIPYIGIIIGTIIPMVVAATTQDFTAALWVLALFSAVQFIDNNIIVPMVVASRVQVNALMSILVVLIGGALWGIPGMFLSIPLTAILKVIFDRVPGLEPFGYLLGAGDESKEKPAPTH